LKINEVELGTSDVESNEAEHCQLPAAVKLLGLCRDAHTGHLMQASGKVHGWCIIVARGRKRNGCAKLQIIMRVCASSG